MGFSQTILGLHPKFSLCNPSPPTHPTPLCYALFEIRCRRLSAWNANNEEKHRTKSIKLCMEHNSWDKMQRIPCIAYNA